jgi:hypothetical protein
MYATPLTYRRHAQGFAAACADDWRTHPNARYWGEWCAVLDGYAARVGTAGLQLQPLEWSYDFELDLGPAGGAVTQLLTTACPGDVGWVDGGVAWTTAPPAAGAVVGVEWTGLSAAGGALCSRSVTQGWAEEGGGCAVPRCHPNQTQVAVLVREAVGGHTCWSATVETAATAALWPTNYTHQWPWQIPAARGVAYVSAAEDEWWTTLAAVEAQVGAMLFPVGVGPVAPLPAAATIPLWNYTALDTAAERAEFARLQAELQALDDQASAAAAAQRNATLDDSFWASLVAAQAALNESQVAYAQQKVTTERLQSLLRTQEQGLRTLTNDTAVLQLRFNAYVNASAAATKALEKAIGDLSVSDSGWSGWRKLLTWVVMIITAVCVFGCVFKLMC